MKRIPELDALRGLAALYVILFHTAFSPQPNLGLPGVALLPVLFGGTGILLFFVISGFSLSMTMPRHSASGRLLWSYSISRIFRIAPLFYFILALSVGRDYFLSGVRDPLGLIGINALFLFNLFPSLEAGIVWASWTIGIEMLYYVLFPIIYSLSSRNKVVLLFGSAALCLALGPDGPWPHLSWFSAFGFLPVFLTGELAFTAYSRLQSHADSREWGMAAILLSGAILLSTMLIPEAEKSLQLRYLIGLGYALLLAGVILCPGRVLRTKIFGFYGKISYSTYLSHAPVVYSLSPVYPKIFSVVPFDIAYFLCLILTIAIVTPISWVLYRYVELPGIRFGSRLIRPRLAIPSALSSQPLQQ